MGFSNSSIGYLNYPTQVIFKCCKLIPVMLGSVVLQGKRYGPLDISAVICMCIGLVLFTLADSQVSPHFNVIGKCKDKNTTPTVSVINPALNLFKPLLILFLLNPIFVTNY